MPLDSSQRPPLNDQRRDGDVVPIVPKEAPTAEQARSGGPTRDRGASATKSPPDVDAATPDLVQQLEALARDFAVVLDSERNSSDQHTGTPRERSDYSAQTAEPSIRASPRSSDFKNDLFASEAVLSRPAILTVAGFHGGPDRQTADCLAVQRCLDDEVTARANRLAPAGQVSHQLRQRRTPAPFIQTASGTWRHRVGAAVYSMARSRRHAEQR